MSPELNKPLRTKRDAAKEIFGNLLDSGYYFERGVGEEVRPIDTFILEHYPESEEILLDAELEIIAAKQHAISWKQPL